jgi:hypothetical protein
VDSVELKKQLRELYVWMKEHQGDAMIHGPKIPEKFQFAEKVARVRGWIANIGPCMSLHLTPAAEVHFELPEEPPPPPPAQGEQITKKEATELAAKLGEPSLTYDQIRRAVQRGEIQKGTGRKIDKTSFLNWLASREPSEEALAKRIEAAEESKRRNRSLQ